MSNLDKKFYVLEYKRTMLSDFFHFAFDVEEFKDYEIRGIEGEENSYQLLKNDKFIIFPVEGNLVMPALTKAIFLRKGDLLISISPTDSQTEASITNQVKNIITQHAQTLDKKFTALDNYIPIKYSAKLFGNMNLNWGENSISTYQGVYMKGDVTLPLLQQGTNVKAFAFVNKIHVHGEYLKVDIQLKKLIVNSNSLDILI